MSQRIVGFSAPVRPAEKTQPMLPVGVRNETTVDPAAGRATARNKQAAVIANVRRRFIDIPGR
jgi:hypothetical protein